MTNASPIEVSFTLLTAAGMGAVIVLVAISLRMIIRIWRTPMHNGDLRQAVQELSEDLTSLLVLGFFILIGLRAMALPPTPNGTSGVWALVVAIWIFVINGAMSAVCWMRLLRRLR